MRYVRAFLNILIELLHLVIGLIAVALVAAAAAWAYPPGRDAIAWIGRAVAVGVVLWSIPLFVAAWRKDRAGSRRDA